MSTSPRVASLHLYPLKGARAIDVEEALVTPRGIEGDRRYMVVDQDGVFVSQREAPRLALVTALPGPSGLRLGTPGRCWLEVPLIDAEDALRVVRLWAGTCVGADQGDVAADWLSEWLERPCRLVWQPEGARRGVDQRYALSERDLVSFADGYPLLVCSSTSLAALNQHLEVAIPMNRFRPNLVVEGWVDPWYEDRVARLRAGEVHLSLVKQCARCVVTTVDQRTGEAGREPLRTLARIRRGERGAMFGENAIPSVVGRVAVGDPVRVVEVRDREREPVWTAAET